MYEKRSGLRRFKCVSTHTSIRHSHTDAHEQKLGTYDTIDEVKFLDRTESVHQKHDGLTADRQQQLYGEYQQENMLLDMHVEQSGLAAVYTELLAMIR